MKNITLNISGMTCSHCVMHVTNALKEIPGVVDAKVSLEKKTADVSYDETKVDKDDMAEAVKEAGYKVE
jgi:copper chaperone